MRRSNRKPWRTASIATAAIMLMATAALACSISQPSANQTIATGANIAVAGTATLPQVTQESIQITHDADSSLMQSGGGNSNADGSYLFTLSPPGTPAKWTCGAATVSVYESGGANACATQKININDSSCQS